MRRFQRHVHLHQSRGDGPLGADRSADTCLYDCGLLIDDDDKLYVTHGSTDLNVTQLTPDGLGIARNQQIYAADVYIEGSRMYKWNGVYYIITDQPDNGQYVLKSTAGPWGPYEFGVVLNNTLPPSALDGADTPHQGAFVDTPAGDWYYMAFVDVNGDSTGRVPVLSSISWNDDGWPVLLLDADNTWPESLPYPVDSGATTPNTDSSLTGVDTFASGTLGPQWEWNHNPNKAHFSVSRDGVYLSTASVTDDLYQAQNTLTHRTLGPASQATILLDYRGMADGDRAGLVMLRDSSAYIGISATGTDRTLVIRTGMTLNQTDNWSTISTGSDVATQPLQPSRSKCGARIYLRVAGDFGSSGTRQCQFSYSLDGVSFTSMGQNFTMANDWEFFQAYRFGIFNHATKALGGHVVLKQFALEAVPQ